MGKNNAEENTAQESKNTFKCKGAEDDLVVDDEEAENEEDRCTNEVAEGDNNTGREVAEVLFEENSADGKEEARDDNEEIAAAEL